MSLEHVPLLLPLNLAATTAQSLTFLLEQLMRKIMCPNRLYTTRRMQ